MDVELEQVEEGVGDEVDGAVNLALGAVVEFEGLAGLVARREGDPLDLVVVVFEVLARFPAILGVSWDCFPTASFWGADCSAQGRRRTYELRFMHSTWIGAP